MNSARNQFAQILKDFAKYLEIHKDSDPFPFIYKIPEESIYFPVLKKENQKEEIKENINKTYLLKENQKCNLCKDRLYAVKKFKKEAVEPREPRILLLISHNIFNSKQYPVDNSDKFVFSKEEDELLDRMLSLIHYSLKNIYVMEFVACHFKPESSSEDWQQRIQNCLPFLEKTILENQIQKILVMGNAAILLFQDYAKDYASSMKILSLPVQNIKIPLLVVRSPSAILQLEKKRKEYEDQLKNYPEEYRLFLQNKKNLNELKVQIELKIFSNQGKVIGNIKLKTASQIKTQEQKEKEILQKLGLPSLVLYKFLSYREQEIQIKEQIKNSFLKFSQI